MKKISQIFLYLVVALLLIWQLPWCYTFFVGKKEYTPSAIYSSILGNFLIMGYDKENDKTIRQDLSGHNYTIEEVDSILPFFYVRQLIADNRFPDSVNGIAVSPKEVQLTNFRFRNAAADINCSKIELYPLLESRSKRIELSLPDDVFRITNKGIEFIKINGNVINTQKSQIYTEAMQKKGFQFPATVVAGNPTVRKEYDEGYLILDATGHLFHLKQVVNRPYVRSITLADSIKVKHIFVTEFKDHKTLAFLTDADHNLYILLHHNYNLIKVGIDSFNPENDDISIYGNMFDWTINIDDNQGNDNYYAIDATTFDLIKKISFKYNDGSIPGLHFKDSRDKYVKPRF